MTDSTINTPDNQNPSHSTILSHDEWEIRARKAGLKQVQLATLAGISPNTVYRAFAGHWNNGDVPGYLKAIIMAWEIMNEDQKKEWRENIASQTS